MDNVLQDAITALGISAETRALHVASDYSESLLADARANLLEAVPPGEAGDVDVIILGSYARREASPASDFDYLIVSHSLPKAGDIRKTRNLVHAVENFMKKLEKTDGNNGITRPGSTGLFGKIQSASDLVERIGLEQDTNTTHTRRSLVLQESESIYEQGLHQSLIESILARYLVDYDEPKGGPPRFLLNDLNRYWFTVAVDYQAKRWERLSQGWGIRS